MCIVVYVYN
jgi:hypothetical protein